MAAVLAEFHAKIFSFDFILCITKSVDNTDSKLNFHLPAHDHRGFEALVLLPVSWLTVLIVQIPSSSSICSRKFSFTKSESPTVSFLEPCTFSQYCNFAIINVIMINIYLPHLSVL